MQVKVPFNVSFPVKGKDVIVDFNKKVTNFTSVFVGHLETFTQLALT